VKQNSQTTLDIGINAFGRAAPGGFNIQILNFFMNAAVKNDSSLVSKLGK